MRFEIFDLFKKIFFASRISRPCALGHYYSPIPSAEDIRNFSSRSSATTPPLAIDMNCDYQMDLLLQLSKLYSSMKFPETKSSDFLYYLDNGYYAYSDGIFLHLMLRHLNPRRYIEVGNGYSTCCALDTNRLYMDNRIKITLIDPDQERMNKLIPRSLLKEAEVIPSKIQDVNLNTLLNLEANDILFIDSSHVAKICSDVNFIFEEILPRLKPGVFIHFHDIFYPLEYPKSWILEGRAWNEIYLMRNFLQYNTAFKIVLFNSFLEKHCHDLLASLMPLTLKVSDVYKTTIPGSLWLQKIN